MEPWPEYGENILILEDGSKLDILENSTIGNVLLGPLLVFAFSLFRKDQY